MRTVLIGLAFMFAAESPALAQKPAATYRAGTSERPVDLTDDGGERPSTFDTTRQWSKFFSTASNHPSKIAKKVIHRQMWTDRMVKGSDTAKGLLTTNQKLVVERRLDKLVKGGKQASLLSKLFTAAAVWKEFGKGNPYQAAATASDSVLSGIAAELGAMGAVGVLGMTGATGGTFLVGVGGALLANYAYDKFIKPHNAEVAAEQRLAAVRTLVDEAQIDLRQGKLQEADNTALKAIGGLDAILNADSALAATDTAMSLRSDLRKIHANASEALIIVERVKTYLRSVVADAQRGKFYAVRSTVESFLARKELLVLAHHEDLVQQLQGLENELSRIADSREKSKAGPGKSSTTVKQLTGQAPWRAPQGTASGKIGITIDLERKTFSVNFQGGAGGKSYESYAGAFGGNFVGDAHAGVLNGGGAINIYSHASGGAKKIGTARFGLENTKLNGGVVTGTAVGAGNKYPFSVPVN
jgi:hypothetical protein